jgi:hypothetical protein
MVIIRRVELVTEKARMHAQGRQTFYLRKYGSQNKWVHELPGPPVIEDWVLGGTLYNLPGEVNKGRTSETVAIQGLLNIPNGTRRSARIEMPNRGTGH